jgi:outer membrane lipoprotein SlyB
VGLPAAGTGICRHPGDGRSPLRSTTAIEAIEIYRASDNQPVNVGTVLGGLAGGVIGHQVGSGRGSTAATIAGAIGGAVIGNEIEKKQVQGSRYRITVRLDSGSTLIVEDIRDVNLRVGDRCESRMTASIASGAGQ